MRLTRFLLRLLPATLVILFAVWCAVRLQSDLQATSLAPVWHSWDLVLVATLLSVANYLFRTVRWREYLAALGHKLPLGFTWLTYVAGFAFTLSPGKVGEVARARYYTPLGIPLRQVAAAFCLERLLDALAMLALAMIVLAAFPQYSIAIWGTASGVAGVVGLALVLPRMLRWSQATERGPGKRRTGRFAHASRRGLGRVGAVLEAARPLLRPKGLLMGLGLGVLAWGLEGIGLYVLSFMFPGSHLTLEVAVGIYAVAVLAGALALLPGGLGGTEAVMTALLVSQGYPFAASLVITLACRLVTLWFAVVLGWAAIMVLRVRGVLRPHGVLRVGEPALEEVTWQPPGTR
jgi:glycosyltransferase 2 family protein